MSSVFDGLADIFAATLGEPVVYTPVVTGVPATITAIWLERPLDVVMRGESGTDDISTELHVRAVDVPAPKEGDTVVRSGTGKTARVVAPIRPDDKGMIACTLELA
jgi:hypothetical protein